jgi:hypothetical protein
MECRSCLKGVYLPVELLIYLNWDVEEGSAAGYNAIFQLEFGINRKIASNLEERVCYLNKL